MTWSCRTVPIEHDDHRSELSLQHIAVPVAYVARKVITDRSSTARNLRKRAVLVAAETAECLPWGHRLAGLLTRIS